VTRVWLITGASRGIGEAVARLAAGRGDRVALVARGERIAAVAHELGGLALRADLADAEALGPVVEETLERYGRIDVLVNNAGIHRGGRLERLRLDDFREVLETDLVGPFELCRLVAPHMPAGAAIVNVGAVVGFRGFPGDSPYGAAKAGLAGLTRVLAVELARRGVTANLVVPGLTDTDLIAGVDAPARERIVRGIPLGRMAGPEEIARVIAWVAGTPYMTGSVVVVDGGLMAALGR
jgi:NAD(P)-dependent dehydrogenase (short-subunit alcohol dehydrogenase family)